MTSSLTSDPLGAWIAELVHSACEGPLNSLQNGAGDRAWGEPLVGFSRGDDPLYTAYKQHVGPEHWTPAEILALTFPQVSAAPGDLSVISWVLPQTSATKADNRSETVYPAERWARARIFGEAFNDHLRRTLVSALAARGYEAVAPQLAAQWASVKSERFVYSSTWSERHAAYAAGLGTFGLCDGLITARGKAMRVGSVVARLALPPTPRPYQDHHAYCLFYAKGTCGACMTRCPAGAISAAGHDKATCRQHVAKTAAFVKENYGFEGYGCGLCQTGVPCESGVPSGISD
jgi:epoxyqueuosine reductase